MSWAVLILAALAGAGLLVTAAIAYPRQIGGTDPAARGGWWLDYDEHATVIALAGVLAASRGPGWRVLRALCNAVWLYLGMVAALALPHHPGSWGRIGGAAALLVGVGFGVAAWRGFEPIRLTHLPDLAWFRDFDHCRRWIPAYATRRRRSVTAGLTSSDRERSSLMISCAWP